MNTHPSHSHEATWKRWATEIDMLEEEETLPGWATLPPDFLDDEASPETERYVRENNIRTTVER